MFKGIASALALCLSLNFASANVLTNGDFETGDFTGWTVGSTQDIPYTSVFGGGESAIAMNDAGTEPAWAIRDSIGGDAPNITNYSAFNGFDGTDGHFYLQQGFSLSGPSTGTLEFDWGIYTNIFAGLDRSFTVNILDASETHLSTVFSHIRSAGITPWSLNQETINLDPVLLGLSSGSYVLQFKMDIPETFTGPASMSLDNISLVTSSATIPEPSTYALMALGLVGLGVYRRKRK